MLVWVVVIHSNYFYLARLLPSGVGFCLLFIEGEGEGWGEEGWDGLLMKRRVVFM